MYNILDSNHHFSTDHICVVDVGVVVCLIIVSTPDPILIRKETRSGLDHGRTWQVPGPGPEAWQYREKWVDRNDWLTILECRFPTKLLNLQFPNSQAHQPLHKIEILNKFQDEKFIFNFYLPVRYLSIWCIHVLQVLYSYCSLFLGFSWWKYHHFHSSIHSIYQWEQQTYQMSVRESQLAWLSYRKLHHIGSSM